MPKPVRAGARRRGPPSRAHLRDLAVDVHEDDAGARTSARPMGNLDVRLAPRPTDKAARRCSWARTSTPCRPRDAIEPVVGEDGIVRNARRDDPRRRRQVRGRGDARRRHGGSSRKAARTPGIELLFTPMEEVGLEGAGRIRPRAARREGSATCTTKASPIGDVILGAPHQALDRRHLPPARRPTPGIAPEEGRFLLIAAASRAIADLRLGRLDDITTASVGLINGGTARNVVPETMHLHLRRPLARPGGPLGNLIREMLETPPPSPRPSPSATWRPRSRSKTSSGYRFRQSDEPPSASPPEALQPRRLRAELHPHGRRCRRERLQRARAAVPQPRQRHGEHSLVGRAHRRRRPRGDGRCDARARRRGSPRRSTRAARPASRPGDGRPRAPARPRAPGRGRRAVRRLPAP